MDKIYLSKIDFGLIHRSNTYIKSYHIFVPDAHVEKPYSTQGAPVGPVAGGIMACFLVLALGVYCYCHRVHRSTHQYMSTPDTQYRMGMEEHFEELDPDIDGGGHLGPGKYLYASSIKINYDR